MRQAINQKKLLEQIATNKQNLFNMIRMSVVEIGIEKMFFWHVEKFMLKEKMNVKKKKKKMLLLAIQVAVYDLDALYF